MFIKERNKIGILRFFVLFLKIWNMDEIYKVERIGERVEHCPIPTSMPKREKMKLFYKYWVFLPIKWLEKKKEIFGLKPTLFRINKKIWWLSNGKKYAMLKANILIWRPSTYSEWIRCVRRTSVSIVKWYLRPPSWLGWTKFALMD